MTSRELVIKTMKGENPGRTPIYGWVKWNMEKPLKEMFGSGENFEDAYGFDMAHIFGGPGPFDKCMAEYWDKKVTITLEMVLDIALDEVDRDSDYDDVRKALAFHRQRDRFCYVQTDGIFETVNHVFGIENHLLYMALYPEELKEIYSKLADWNIKRARNMVELGVDGIHVSDDWGAQNSLMFSPAMFREMIYPAHKKMLEEYKKYDVLVSLHSDGCVTPALDSIAELGYDFIHPWQENCKMPYSLYLDKYQDKFGILGGVCVQSTLGFDNYERLEAEIRRVFGLLKGKRWACCTTHFVQEHCSIEELVFAYDLIRKLAN